MARYRCPHCGHETGGPDRRAPSCPRCGLRTLRILEKRKVIDVERWT